MLNFHLNRIDTITHKDKLSVTHHTQFCHPSSQSHSPNNISEGRSSCYWGTPWDCYPLVREVSLLGEEIHSQSTEFWQFIAALQLTAEICIFKIICPKGFETIQLKLFSHHLSWPFQWQTKQPLQKRKNPTTLSTQEGTS